MNRAIDEKVNADIEALLEDFKHLDQVVLSSTQRAQFLYSERLCQRAKSSGAKSAQLLLAKSRSVFCRLQQSLVSESSTEILANDRDSKSNVLATQAFESLLASIAAPIRVSTSEPLSEFAATLKQQQAEVLSLSDTIETISAVESYRQSLLELNLDQLLKQALADCPEDPGPLNPQMLIIKALSSLAELSPAYLSRFVDYIDTALWLETATVQANSARRKRNRG